MKPDWWDDRAEDDYWLHYDDPRHLITKISKSERTTPERKK